VLTVPFPILRASLNGKIPSRGTLGLSDASLRYSHAIGSQKSYNQANCLASPNGGTWLMFLGLTH